MLHWVKYLSNFRKIKIIVSGIVNFRCCGLVTSKKIIGVLIFLNTVYHWSRVFSFNASKAEFSFSLLHFLRAWARTNCWPTAGSSFAVVTGETGNGTLSLEFLSTLQNNENIKNRIYCGNQLRYQVYFKDNCYKSRDHENVERNIPDCNRRGSSLERKPLFYHHSP